MLCPNVMTVGDMLSSAYSNIKKTDSFVFGCMNTSIGYLSPDPVWLGQLRSRMSMLRDTCAIWQQDKPDIWSQMLLPFVNYYTLFEGFTKASKDFGNDREIWLSSLTQLKNELTVGKNAAQIAENQFQKHINDLKNLEVLIVSSVNDAWKALGKEEEQIVKLASEITHLQDEINQLQEEITSAEISGGMGYTKSVVKIGYSILIEGSTAVPYLTIAGLVFTVGELAYDLISKSVSIRKSLEKIAQLQLEATQEAQAIAATKAIIQLITNLRLNMVALKDNMPDFSNMWSNEIEKIDQVINAINSGVDPSIYIDIKSMPSALATWKTLSDFVPKVTKGSEEGKEVILNISE